MSLPTPKSTENAAPAQAAALMQQPVHHPLPGRVLRQQQQNNGFPEFQPKRQMGDLVADDSAHTLSAYLDRAGKAGDLPGARLDDIAEVRLRKPQQQ